MKSSTLTVMVLVMLCGTAFAAGEIYYQTTTWALTTKTPEQMELLLSTAQGNDIELLLKSARAAFGNFLSGKPMAEYHGRGEFGRVAAVFLEKEQLSMITDGEDRFVVGNSLTPKIVQVYHRSDPNLKVWMESKYLRQITYEQSNEGKLKAGEGQRARDQEAETRAKALVPGGGK